MAINLPVQNYFRRIQGQSAWTRPVDWPVITDAPNEVQFLMSDLGDSNCSLRTNFARTSGSQDMVIDWGDGTTTTISATGSTTTNKTYTPGTGTPCSLGYTTFKIRVYFTGTGVSVLQTCQITSVFISGVNFSTQNCGVLEVYYGDGTPSVSTPTYYAAQGASTSPSYYNNLTYVKFASTVTWTSMNNMFSGCTGLRKVVMPTSAASLTDLASCFLNCYLLDEIVLPSNATSITTFSTTFQNCFNLKSIILPTTLNSVTTFFNAFNANVNLRNITFPSINLATNFNAALGNCYNLEWVKFTSMPTVVAAINFNAAFTSCFNLQNVYFPATGSSAPTFDFTNCFQNCQQLKSVIFPSNINASTFSQTFGSCTSLIRCVLPTNMPSCTTLANIFTSCYSLTNVTLPLTASSGISFANAFFNCYRLETITIPSTLTIGSFSQTFNGCAGLKTVNWAAGAQNSITSLASAFSGCRNLEAITFPTSMLNANNLSGTFTNCTLLKTVVFPASLTNISTISQLFQNCVNLTSITLPTSMNACTGFLSVFQGCRLIKSVTLPNTVSIATTSFGSIFADCGSLQTVVLPGAAQLINVNSIDAMFTGCANLVTITNFDKIGSLTATPLASANSIQYNRFTSISFSGPLSILGLNGPPIVNGRVDVQSVRLLNASAGQWTGSSPQINVAYTNMSTANLVQLFNDMAAQGNVTSKTINITLATGAAGLTAADRLIVTSKGWTITG
jgi:hypothetical protein